MHKIEIPNTAHVEVSFKFMLLEKHDTNLDSYKRIVENVLEWEISNV